MHNHHKVYIIEKVMKFTTQQKFFCLSFDVIGKEWGASTWNIQYCFFEQIKHISNLCDCTNETSALTVSILSGWSSKLWGDFWYSYWLLCNLYVKFADQNFTYMQLCRLSSLYSHCSSENLVSDQILGQTTPFSPYHLSAYHFKNYIDHTWDCKA